MAFLDEIPIDSQIINPRLLHEHNLHAVLARILNEQPVSRASLAQQMNTTRSSITVLFRELESAGYVVELGEGSVGENGGRKPVMVAINDDYGYSVSIDFGIHEMLIVSNDLSGHVLTFHKSNTDGKSIESILDMIENQLKMLKSQDQTDHGLLGLSFVIHGPVVDNQVINSPFLDMHDLDLAAYFEERYHVQVIQENEANLVAICARDFHSNPSQTRNLLAISIHRGLGAGTISNHQLYHGDGGGAGEIGHVIATSKDNQQMSYKAEDFCSEEAVVKKVLGRRIVSQLNRDKIASLYQQHDTKTVKVLNEFTAHLAQLIINSSKYYDPDQIFISSCLIDTIPSLLSDINCQYRDRLSEQLLPIPIIQMRRAEFSSIWGAFSLITRRVLNLEHAELMFHRPSDNGMCTEK